VTASAEELATDLAPFRDLADAPMGMTGHLLFTAWDSQRPSTLSPIVIESVIRQQIGFDGLLFTDDLDMEALSGSVPERAAAAQAAGCDIALNCWAKMDDMAGICATLHPMSAATQVRLDRAKAAIAAAQQHARASADADVLIAQRDQLIAAARA
jgi:beta-N-acetylhexosaminidase